MTATPETKLKRFLHLGRESPIYQPVADEAFKTHLTSIDEFIAEDKATEAVTHIVKAFSDGYSANEKFLVYALACCARQKTSTPLRVAAYNAFKTVCKSAENMFFFIKVATELSAPHAGWGHGLRRVVKEWYLNQDPLQLAECVTRYRQMFLWSHRDIMRMAHISTEDIAKQTVLLYIFSGMEAAQQEFGDKPAAIPVLQYLKTAEEFKHSTNPETAARMLEQHGFFLEHVPSHLFKWKEMWLTLVPRLPLAVLLKSLNRLGRKRLLKGNSMIATRVIEALENQTALEESNLHPAEILIILRKYELSGRPKYIPAEPSKVVKLLPQPNARILEALTALMESSFTLLASTGLRYVVVVDTAPKMLTSMCARSHLHALRAAAMITHTLVQAERDVTVMAFGVNTMVPVPLNKDMCFNEAYTWLKQIPSTTRELADPIIWAEQLKKPVDVFVIITDVQLFSEIKPVDALKQYRTSLNLPNTKLVVCALHYPQFSVASPEDPGMLDIAGFDGRVPRIIEAFSRGAF